MVAKKSKGANLGKKMFIDGLDSYTDEYEKWKKTDLVKQLVGVYELPAEQFNEKPEANLATVGKSHLTVIRYEAEVDNIGEEKDEQIVGTGHTVVVRDQYGKVRPIIFIRLNINSKSIDESEEHGENMRDGIRLLVLMHEMGHADDVARSINFDHENKKLDIVKAEAYAHQFVCKHAARLNYRIALMYYLQNIEEGLKSTNPSVHLSSKLAIEQLDMPALKKLTVVGTGNLEQMLKKAGRMHEIVKK